MKKLTLLRKRVSYWCSIIVGGLLMTAGSSKAQAVVVGASYAILASTDIKSALGDIMALIMGIAAIGGTVTVIQGLRENNRGEEGNMKIVGGIGIALAPMLVKWAYNKFAPGAAVDVGSLDSY